MDPLVRRVGEYERHVRSNRTPTVRSDDERLSVTELELDVNTLF